MTIPTVGKWDVGTGLAAIGDTIFKMLHPDYAAAAEISDQISTNPQVAQQYADSLYLGGQLPPMNQRAFQMIRGMQPSSTARVESIRRKVLAGQEVTPEEQENLRGIALYGNVPFGAITGAESREEVAKTRAAASERAAQIRAQVATRQAQDRLDQFNRVMAFREQRAGADDEYRRNSLEIRRAAIGVARSRVAQSERGDNEALVREIVRMGIPLEQARQYVLTSGASDTTGSVARTIMSRGARQYYGIVTNSIENLVGSVARLQSRDESDENKTLAMAAANASMQTANSAFETITGTSLFPAGGRVIKESRPWTRGGDRYVVQVEGQQAIPLDDLLTLANAAAVRMRESTPPENETAPATTPPATPTPNRPGQPNRPNRPNRPAGAGNTRQELVASQTQRMKDNPRRVYSPQSLRDAGFTQTEINRMYTEAGRNATTGAKD